MFKKLSLMMQNNAFLRVSADTIRGQLPYSCGSPLYPAPTGGLRLPSGKH
jgi:hypothetical protein